MGGPMVNVKQGWLRGTIVKSVVGGSYISFKGIPFAAPPLGDLRFSDPQPPRPWTGVRDASKEGPKCIQIDYITSNMVGDEDCLYLNVATTSLKGSRPVMVWIHGGAFIMGDGGDDMFGPDYLMKQDILVVSIQYRLGVFGFLKLDHEVVPGNMGLKDQVAALKWVRENIAQFGGDPNNVTLFGESAGSSSVHYQLVSPISKGLFHKAIMQSGTMLFPWIGTPLSVETARRYVAVLGNEITDPHEIVEYLRTVPAAKLIEAQEQFQTDEDRFKFLTPFRPSVDDKSKEPFMPKPPEELAVEGFDVPVIIGYNSHEGILFLLTPHDWMFEELDKNFERTVPADLIMENPSKVSQVADELRKFYFKDKPITTDAVSDLVRYYGDTYFLNGTQKVVEYQQKKRTPTYFYKFSYDSPKSLTKLVYKSSMKGTSHEDEVPYLFHPLRFADLLKIEPNSIEQTVSDRFVKMWTDFAKTGNPTPQIDDLITVKWDPVTRTTKNYLEIGSELSAGVNPDEEVELLFKRISDIVKSNLSQGEAND
ncbi:esterase FE4-like isoform X1 [Neodiprion lecontei]|uniref:Carboxylic ester hydrolase n=1 Tax=Neodiprion lecontei TaxID=441921 RepID=A0A6J0BVA9_NEOLC|nr:esterase FE4-like isoform X1 [Neodiprion lecontei]